MLRGFPYTKLFPYSIQRASLPNFVFGQNLGVSSAATRLPEQLKNESSLFDFFAMLSDDLCVRF